MLDSLKLTAKTLMLGCGIYEAGDTDKCYTSLFVTDGGRVLPVNHRAISQEDLMQAYIWGRMEERETSGTAPVEDTETDYDYYVNDGNF